VFEDSLWPLLLVKFGRNSTDEDLETYLESRYAYLRRRERHVVIIDTREVHLPSVRQRQRYADWLREHEVLIRQWTLGSAYVIASPTVRMMASVIRHFGAMSTPFLATTTLPPAAAWAAERLGEAGLAQAAARVRASYSIPTS
jgi:hypothetical protein